ncbi:hypothetical protein MHK74_12670 [Microbacterium aurum]|uniref:hypothetical protein n=1 Tax=Microbacterium aurum TaxID=36805 RepID=UPI001EF73D05|nr:hypothetical protein [Microbacterium aurum]MCG7415405.1 hypothetical protein [Microbacterium aurum]
MDASPAHGRDGRAGRRIALIDGGLELRVVQAAVRTVRGQQFVVCALLDDRAVLCRR